MLTQDDLKKVYIYNPHTGLFSSINTGNTVGTPHKGYIILHVERKPYKAHRLAWLYTYGNMPTLPIDHVNGIGSDNRIWNLREATHQQNMCNSKTPVDNRLGIKGLKYIKATGRRNAIYTARVACLGITYTKSISVGKNSHDEDVIEALVQWLKDTRKQLHGDFCNDG